MPQYLPEPPQHKGPLVRELARRAANRARYGCRGDGRRDRVIVVRPLSATPCAWELVETCPICRGRGCD